MDCDLVARAAAFAGYAHGSIQQLRKYTGEPYIVHPEEVAGIVADVTDDQAVIAAAWLHDVLEDTPVTYNQVWSEFGPRVAQLVVEVTDVSKPEDGNRAARKALDCMHLAKASAAGQTIKLADLISNTRSIVEHDPDFAVVYLREKKALLRVLNRGDSMLHTIASRQVGDAP